MRQAGSRQRVIYWHDRAAGIAEDVPYTLALQRLHDEARPADGLADTERLSVRGRRHRPAAFASGLDCSHAMCWRSRAPTFSRSAERLEGEECVSKCSTR